MILRIWLLGINDARLILGGGDRHTTLIFVLIQKKGQEKINLLWSLSYALFCRRGIACGYSNFV